MPGDATLAWRRGLLMPRARIFKRQFPPRPVDRLDVLYAKLDRPVFSAMHRLIQRCKYDLGMIDGYTYQNSIRQPGAK
jgi:hypothetical protein